MRNLRERLNPVDDDEIGWYILKALGMRQWEKRILCHMPFARSTIGGCIMCKAFVLFVKETLLQINSTVSGALLFSAWLSLRVN